MRPLLLYKRFIDHDADPSHRLFLEKLLSVAIETYPVEDHREADYDHDNPPPELPGTCWCTLPDQNRPWPQLFFNPERADPWHGDVTFIAAGDDIFNLDAEELFEKYGNNISGPGPWELA
jgi:hypothetical protein